MAESSLTATQYKFSLKQSLFGFQMTFVAFGALVLVPLLTGLNASVALFTAGVGTLIFQLITKGKVPVFLASSFAFIAPIQYGVGAWGIPATLCGLAAAGLLYVVFSFLIRWGGSKFLDRVLPPIVTGPVIMVIGLALAPVAVDMASGKFIEADPKISMLVALIAFCATAAVAIWGKGFFKLIPILFGIAVGYLVAWAFGLVDFGGIKAAKWFAMPAFEYPKWSWAAIFYIMPVALAPAIEHVGDVLAIGSVTGKNYVEDPGVQNTMLGDGIATSFAAVLGGPPNTTYSEVTGAVALTKIKNAGIMTWAAIGCVALAFVGKLNAFLNSIPSPVMGGIMIILFGAIAVVGINTLVKAGNDLLQPRSMIIIAAILVTGIGGMSIPVGDFIKEFIVWCGADAEKFWTSASEFKLEKIGLAGIIGVVLNLILPRDKKA